MSEIELPEPAFCLYGHVVSGTGYATRIRPAPDGSEPAYTTDQMRAAILAERERCARVADENAAGIARVNTYRGKVNQVSQHVVDMVESVAAAIRRGSV